MEEDDDDTRSQYTLVSISYIPVAACFLFETALVLWILVAILDESYLSRTATLVMASVSVAITLVASIVSMIIYNRFVDRERVSFGLDTFSLPGGSYFTTSLVFGAIKLALIIFFREKSASIDTIDTSTFADADNFRSIFVYRNILTVFVAFWGVLLFSSVNTFSAYLQQLVLVQATSESANRRKRKKG